MLRAVNSVPMTVIFIRHTNIKDQILKIKNSVSAFGRGYLLVIVYVDGGGLFCPLSDVKVL